MSHVASIPADPRASRGAGDTPLDALPPGTIDAGRVETYAAWSGTPLRYRVVEGTQPRVRLVYVHGIESHGAWFLLAAAELRRRGCTTYLLDRRGSGLNRGADPGDAPGGAAALMEDLHRFREHLGEGPVHLASLSWGGKLAVASALEHPSDWQSVTLITPGLRALVDLPARDKLAVAMGLFTGRTVRVPAPITPEMFTTTPRFLRYIQDDPWRTRTVTARFCMASRALDRRVNRRRARLAMPTLAVLAGHDRIIDNVGVVALLRALRPDARIAVFAGAQHALQFDHTSRLVDRMVRLVLGEVPSRSLP